MVGRHTIKGGLLAAGAVLALGSAPVGAQSVEAILRSREQLELSEQQVQQLDQIRRGAVAERNAEMAQLAELRSQLAAGQIRRSDVMALMEDQQEARQARTEERRASIESILTEAQLDSVQQMRRRGDRQRAGLGRARPGIGRSAPGFGPGRRQGFAPGGRQGFAPGSRRDFAPGGRRGADVGGPGAPGDLGRRGDDTVLGLR